MSERTKGRIEQTIRQTVAALLMRKVKDPRVTDVSILRVDISRDYSVAKIYFNLIGGSEPERVAEAEKGLLSSRGYMRMHVKKHLKLRVIPELVFIFDSSLDRAMHLEEIIESLHIEEDSGEAEGKEQE
ncbi:MAG: 30S ribosome-binding factor RbfA [Candidatus Krumholzibacteria bacterium]|nr:30S ribosome-binding factor RbfA [Candidatus Krumholzibacteria bacterium]